MLTRSQSRGKQQEATEAWEILEASTILMSMASSVIDEGHQPVDKLPSPNIAVFAPAQGQAGRSPLIKRRRDHLRVKLAASLSAGKPVQ